MITQLQSMALELPRLEYHPNRAPFRGVLTLVDVPSDKPPAGARGHRVLLTRAAAERALPSLLGMGLDYAPALDRHDARRKIGIITEAEIVPADGPTLSASPNRVGRPRPTATWVPHPSGRPLATRVGPPSRIEVAGFLYARDFPEVVRELRAGGRQLLGMSYEIADAHVAEIAAAIWSIIEFTFTGAALLRRDKAAYRETWIELAN